MRVGLFAGIAAAVLGIGAYAVRSTETASGRPRVAAPAVAETGPLFLRNDAPSVVSEGKITVHAAPAESALRKEGNALSGAGTGLRATLERELSLETLQKERIDEILREREGRIEEYHREIRVLGVFNPREYDRRTWDLRFESYRRIAAVLNTAQVERLRELMASGRLGDAVAFELDETMVVLD